MQLKDPDIQWIVCYARKKKKFNSFVYHDFTETAEHRELCCCFAEEFAQLRADFEEALKLMEQKLELQAVQTSSSNNSKSGKKNGKNRKN